VTTPEQDPPEIGEYSSPACLLHEQNASFTGQPVPEQQTQVEAREDVRLWRKAKRTVLIARRLAMSSEDRAAATDRITVRLNALLERETGCVGFYWPLRGEYDPRPLAGALHQTGVRLALPVVVDKSQPLIFRLWWPGVAMSKDACNIPVPAEGKAVQPEALLVPLVGFDRDNYRLGYGGGFYDRTIAATPPRPRTIGIGFSCGRLRTIFPQPNDIALDELVVE
jgi:5-formyltetrahydrofolate cyclo-ligase